MLEDQPRYDSGLHKTEQGRAQRPLPPRSPTARVHQAIDWRVGPRRLCCPEVATIMGAQGAVLDHFPAPLGRNPLLLNVQAHATPFCLPSVRPCLPLDVRSPNRLLECAFPHRPCRILQVRL